VPERDPSIGRLRLVPIERDGCIETQVVLPEMLRDACSATSRLYASSGFVPPWTGYVALDGDEPVGTCAFKSAPRDDRVEIAYFTLPAHEARGIATAMARELVRIAHAARPGITIAAQTLPVENASTAILRRLGFARFGWAHDDDAGEVWEWRLHPAAGAAS
jgi:RimJ/RimL family protein N-acetyltransferase